jgi:hypothetical protein
MSERRRLWVAVVAASCAGFLLGAHGLASAQAPPPAQRAEVYSAYEQETINEVLASLHAERETRPEGKIIERIDVVPLEVFEPRDPLPQWLNVFHATTRKYVIRREMLLREGERYQQTLVDETLRNLRVLPQLSIVLVVATHGSAPDRIGVVVITKDVWSLRLSWNVVFTPGGFEELDLVPTETNLFGTHQRVGVGFVYEPAAYTFGATYTIPRIENTRVALATAANVMVNRASGSPEGSFGSLVAGEPLYSGLARWSWDALVTWTDVITRRYVNAQLSTFVDKTTGTRLPFEYDSRTYGAGYEVTRSFGWDTKHDLTLAAEVDSAKYPVSFPGANPIAVADFVRSVVPRADNRIGPSLRYHSYTKRYLRAIDFDTLALQEDHRLGHDVVLRAFPSFHALGSSRDVLSIYGAAQYTVAVRDGLFRALVISDTQFEPDRISDAYVNPALYLVSPTIGNLGRIVLDAGLNYRWRNYLNIIDYLGGDDRLRGYPTSFFFGKDSVALNVEMRSRPVEILSCQAAAVVFYDTGDAFNGFANLEPFESVGLGLRFLFPQLDREVFRMDLGFPLKRPIDPSTGAPVPPVGFLFSFGQAFGAPNVAPASVVPTAQ